jgi:uncharacterized membrane protein YfcA
MMTKPKRVVAASIAAVVVVALAGMSMTHIGPDGPGGILGWAGLVLLFAPSMLASAFGAAANIIIPVFGFFQFFAIFWFILGKRYAKPS